MTDPYEQQLLAVFESCDVGGTGRLDFEGLAKLCDQLHLEDGRHQLMDCLPPIFSFDQFRDALLTLLGASRRHSDIDRDSSPEREVSPKFVFGQKKYGRRSRPESTDQESDENEEDYNEDDDIEDCTFLPNINDDNIKPKKPCSLLIDNCQPESDTLNTPTSVQSIVLDKEDMECTRGQGEAELRAAWRQLGVGVHGYLDPTELASVCRAVGMEKMADEVVKQVFAKLAVDAEGRISFEEFLQLFHGSHTAHSRDPPTHPSFQQSHLNSLDITSSGYVSSDSLCDLWEAGGVVNASGLLQDLGVTSPGELSLASIAAILDEEIRSMASKSVISPSPQVNSLTAALVLAHTQLKWTRCCLEQMTGERDKLHSDLTDANQRAALLAHEVDDRHARMERASQMQIKLLEQRHAEQVKQLSVQLAVDRDQLTAATLRLEKRLALQHDEETKLRADLQKLHQECESMEKENQSLAEQLAVCELAKSKAEKDTEQIEQLQQRVQELESSSEQVQSLVEQLSRLQTENTCLRDRNDELAMQVENLSARPICKRQNSSESGGTKRRGNSPLALAPDQSWDEESPRLGKVRRYCADTDLSLDSVPMEGLAIGRTLRHSESGLEADLETLDTSLTLSSPSGDKGTFTVGDTAEPYISEIERLRTAVNDLRQENDEYRRKLSMSCPSFKGSPEIMKTPPCMLSLNEKPLKFDAEDRENSSDYNFTDTMVTESTEVQTSLENNITVNQLEQHCHELRHTLENVQDEILKILSEKKECTEENCVLKQRMQELSRTLPKTLNDEPKSLENTNGPLTFTLSDVPLDILKVEPLNSEPSKESPSNIALKCFPFMNRKQSNSNSPYTLFPVKDKSMNGDFKFENLSQFAFELSQSLSDTNFVDNTFSDLGCKPLSPFSEKDNTGDITISRVEVSDNMKVTSEPKCSEPMTMTISPAKSSDLTKVTSVPKSNGQMTVTSQESALAKLTKENEELREKCTELETSLEMMRVEYEKCEDYWQGKLNEERALSDQEQRLSDEKFAELEAKIQEYAEMFAVEEKRGSGRLPTIDERDILEKQVTDLEEEFEEYKRAARQEAALKTELITRLQVELEESLHKHTFKEMGTCDVAVQATTTEQPCEFRLHETRSCNSKACVPVTVPVIEVTSPDSIECCCPCHSLSRKHLARLRESRSRLQAECDVLHRRREVMLHQISQMHQRANLLYVPMPDRRLASDVEMFHNMSARLRHQDLRCRHLQSALKHHQRQTDKLLHNAWEQHRADLSSVQKTLSNTQEKLVQQTKLCKQQMERLAASDVLVKDLYKENSQLTALVQKMEEQNMFVDQAMLASTV